MKYGLLYFKETNNIGDDIQTYAASRFLPRIDYMIDREHIEDFVPKNKEYVSTIMNAWYVHDIYNFNFSPYINPLYTSMFFKRFPYTDGITWGVDYLTNNIKDCLKEHGPVGCRDMHTKKIMDEIGVESYFSGCMTLTLDRLNNDSREDYIVTVGLSNEEVKYIKTKTKRKVIVFKQDVAYGSFKDETWDERKKRVEETLDLYGKAHMVITTKLHCSLPCLAIGTPILLLYDTSFPENKDRIGTYTKYLNYVNRNEFMNTDVDFEKPIKNKNKHLKLRNELIKKCKSFIEESNKNKYDVKKLPEISDYINYTNKSKASRQYIISNLEKLQAKYVKECSKSEMLFNKYNELENKYNALNKELTEIVNSKGYRALEKIRKIMKGNK